MFPIVHYFANLHTYGQVPPLMILGGLFPDLASGTGMDRNDAHQMGAAFYHWCKKEADFALPFARGVISHGVLPHGVDYYADESWPGSARGWCFEQGRPWIERIAAVTRLPESLWWWKSHNFVEMSYELITIARHPEIGQNIAAATQDEALLKEVAELIHRYNGRDKGLVMDIFRRAPEIFALTEVDADAMALRQDGAYRRRHHVFDADIDGISDLLTEMSESLRGGYDYYMPLANDLVAQMLMSY